MVMKIRNEPRSKEAERRSLGQGGPVFYPPRKLSDVARVILSAPADERVTAYDEQWYLGRPQEA